MSDLGGPSQSAISTQHWEDLELYIPIINVIPQYIAIDKSIDGHMTYILIIP